jgi:hypothetical protein
VAVRLEHDADPEGIPRAVRIPVAIASVYAERGRDGRERIRHADLRARKVEDEHVRLVQPPPALLHLVSRGSDGLAGLLERRCAAESHEKCVGRIAELDVSHFHG